MIAVNPKHITSRLLEETGHATLEYAIVLGAILAATVAGGSLLGRYVSQPTRGITVALQTSSENSGTPSTEIESDSRIGEFEATTALVGSAAILLMFLVWRSTRKTNPGAAKAGPVQGNRRQLPEKDVTAFRDNRRRIYAIIKSHRHELSSWTMRVEDVMSECGQTVSPRNSRSELLLSFEKTQANFLLVTDNSLLLKGVAYRWVAKDQQYSTVSQVMSDVPHCLDPNTHLSVATDLMYRHNLDWIPVVSDGTLVGIVTKGDILATLLSMLQFMSEVDHEFKAILDRAVGVR